MSALAPWSAAVQRDGCSWLIETSWSESRGHWELWLGCEGQFAGVCHLEAQSFGAGDFRIVDSEGLLAQNVEEALRHELEAVFFANSTVDEERLLGISPTG